jgi:hypothetical protein
MITFRITTDIKDDRRVVLTLPPEVPTGQAELVVSIQQPTAANKPTYFGSTLEFLESLPPGPRAFKRWEEYERHLQEEKNSWERSGSQ